jgi:hypothetical protein
LSTAILSLLAFGAVIGVMKFRRRSTENTGDALAATRLVIGLLPAVALGLLALGGIPVYFAGRTESMVWPLAAALIAILISGLPVLARLIVALPYLLLGAATVTMWLVALPARPPAPGVEVGRYLATQVQEGDRVVVAGLWELEVRHGIAVEDLNEGTSALSTIEVETFPHSQAAHPGWLDRDVFSSPELLQEARALRESAESERSRIWLVWSPVLPLEENFFPAFSGWWRGAVGGSQIVAVDLLIPPPHDDFPFVQNIG